MLLLLSWWYGQSSFEQRLDPVGAANKERNNAIKDRDDAQRAWQEMGTKYERAMETNLKLQAEFSKASKDLPWLEQRSSELAEKNILQNNEIKRLKTSKQEYDDLLQQVRAYGMSAKRPEYYQQRSESVQRQLELTNNLLENSKICVKALEEKLGTQCEKANKEKDWLRAQLKKNARSTAYWARYRPNDAALEIKPPWGIRCACTESEIAYSLKDQSPRIVELEATVKARDLTITHIRESRAVGVRKNGTASTVNAVNTSLPSTEYSNSNSIAGSPPATETLVHACKHEEQCKNLGKQVADDAKTMKHLRKECQDLRDAASNSTTADAAGISAKAKLEGESEAKDTVIKDLREDLAARNETIDDLQKKEGITSEKLAASNQEIKDLRKEKVTTGEELAAKTKEIDELREEKTAADENASTEISNLSQELSESRKDLADAREGHAECERKLTAQKDKTRGLETAQRGLEDAIRVKDSEIDDLETANQELAQQPAPESAESLQRLTTANTNLDALRREHAQCKGQSETQTARISELETTERQLGVTINVKDHRIANLEEQINNAPSSDLIERQNQSHGEAISNKDREYQALYDLYEKMLGQQQLAEAKRNEDMQSLTTMQQSADTNHLELQRLWTEYNNFRVLHTNCEGHITDLTSQLRQGANTYTDLQIIYNTQATELDEANQNASGLRSQVARLQQAITSLEQMNSSESNFDPSIWQANFDREMSAQASKLEASEGQVFKLQNQLQQVKNQANPLREMQIQAREDAVKAKEDALMVNTDAMDHDQQGSKVDPEIKILEGKLAVANKDAGDGTCSPCLFILLLDQILNFGSMSWDCLLCKRVSRLNQSRLVGIY